jgi:predicted negative regulator of RcsB-dependent stress response
MKRSPTIARVKKFVRVTIVLGALAYAAWRLWQQNQDRTATWAASTDRVE